MTVRLASPICRTISIRLRARVSSKSFRTKPGPSRFRNGVITNSRFRGPPGRAAMAAPLRCHHPGRGVGRISIDGRGRQPICSATEHGIFRPGSAGLGSQKGGLRSVPGAQNRTVQGCRPAPAKCRQRFRGRRGTAALLLGRTQNGSLGPSVAVRPASERPLDQRGPIPRNEGPVPTARYHGPPGLIKPLEFLDRLFDRGLLVNHADEGSESGQCTKSLRDSPLTRGPATSIIVIVDRVLRNFASVSRNATSYLDEDLNDGPSNHRYGPSPSPAAGFQKRLRRREWWLVS
jgi:hypothetical protein